MLTTRLHRAAAAAEAERTDSRGQRTILKRHK